MTSYESHISTRNYDEAYQCIATTNMRATLSTYMTSNLLFDTRSFKVIVGHGKVSPHLVQSLRSNGIDTQLGFSLGQTEPKLAPGRVPRPLAEELGHLSAAVAACQGCLVDIVRALLRHLELLNLLLQLLDLGLSVLGLFGHFERQRDLFGDSFLCSNGNDVQRTDRELRNFWCFSSAHWRHNLD